MDYAFFLVLALIKSPNFILHYLWQCIMHKQERECYEYVLAEGMMVHKQTGDLLDTNLGLQGSKWIFIMSTSKKLYASEVKTDPTTKPFVESFPI